MLWCHYFIFLQKALLEWFLVICLCSELKVSTEAGVFLLTLTFLLKGKTSGVLLNLTCLNWKLGLQSMWETLPASYGKKNNQLN